jgi:hypothetical protein
MNKLIEVYLKFIRETFCTHPADSTISGFRGLFTSSPVAVEKCEICGKEWLYQFDNKL